MAEDVALDGFLDEEIVSGHHGASARFRIIVSPTDERADEMLMPCTVNNPAMGPPCCTTCGPATS
ncbi:hypothetical protein [Streptomyces chartreusis]|uniref:hypothetical protein n=1 Tax=Streptomyces chartreusis TaxID=1969 RepID=UPI0037A97F83